MAKGDAAAKPARTNGKKVNLNEVAKISELKDLGFVVSVNDGVYSAARGTEGSDGYEFFGPCSSASALHTKVKLGAKPQQFTDRDETEDLPEGSEKLTEDSNGQKYLPGQEPVVLKNLSDWIKQRHEVALQLNGLRIKVRELNDLIIAEMHKREDQLPKNPDTGSLTYRVGDIIAELDVTESEKLKTRTANSDDE